MKIKFLEYAITLALMISFVSVSGQQPVKDVASFRKKFAEASAGITSIESNFIQEKNLSMISEKIITRGKFYFKKENKLRWEYTTPFSYLFILNNGKAFVKDEEKQSKIDVKSNRMFSEINSILIGSVQGTLLNDEKNFSSLFFENTSSYIARMKPKATSLKTIISEIVITFDKKDMSVAKIEIIEPSGDNTIISFTGKKTNSLLNDEKFIIP